MHACVQRLVVRMAARTHTHTRTWQIHLNRIELLHVTSDVLKSKLGHGRLQGHVRRSESRSRPCQVAGHHMRLKGIMRAQRPAMADAALRSLLSALLRIGSPGASCLHAVQWAGSGLPQKAQVRSCKNFLVSPSWQTPRNMSPFVPGAHSCLYLWLWSCKASCMHAL